MSEVLTPEEKAEALLAQEIADAWFEMINTKSGRLVLWSILEKCGTMDFSHYGGEIDILRKGRQQIGSELLSDYVFPYGVAPYTDMLLEAEIRDQALELAAAQTEREKENEGQT